MLALGSLASKTEQLIRLDSKDGPVLATIYPHIQMLEANSYSTLVS
jgi:hypothetical protein